MASRCEHPIAIRSRCPTAAAGRDCQGGRLQRCHFTGEGKGADAQHSRGVVRPAVMRGDSSNLLLTTECLLSRMGLTPPLPPLGRTGDRPACGAVWRACVLAAATAAEPAVVMDSPPPLSTAYGDDESQYIGSDYHKLATHPAAFAVTICTFATGLAYVYLRFVRGAAAGS